MVLVGRGQAKLHEDRRHMPLHAALGEVEDLRDRAVRLALGHHPQHLALALGGLVERPWPIALPSMCATTSGSRAEPGSRAPCRRQDRNRGRGSALFA